MTVPRARKVMFQTRAYWLLPVLAVFCSIAIAYVSGRFAGAFYAAIITPVLFLIGFKPVYEG